MSDMPHFGYVDSNRMYLIEELMHAWGYSDKRTVMKIIRDYSIDVVPLPKKRIGVPGRSILLALEQNAKPLQEWEFNEHD